MLIESASCSLRTPDVAQTLVSAASRLIGTQRAETRLKKSERLRDRHEMSAPNSIEQLHGGRFSDQQARAPFEFGEPERAGRFQLRPLTWLSKVDRFRDWALDGS